MLNRRKFSFPLYVGVVILVMLVMVLAVACGNQSKPTTSEKPAAQTPAPAPEKKLTPFRIAGGSSGGTYGIHSAAMGSVMEKHVPNLNVTVGSSSSGVENVQLVNSHEVDVGMVPPENIIQAYKGEGPFAGKPATNLRLVLTGFDSLMQVAVAKNSPVKQLTDLKGKRISLGPPGSASLPEARKLFKAAGLTEYKELQVSHAESVEAFRQKQLDASFYISAFPIPSLVELATTTEVKLVPYPKGLLSKLDPWYFETVLPGGVLKGLDQPTESVGRFNALVAHKDVSDDLIYQFTKVITENPKELAAIAKLADSWSAKLAAGRGVIPWHPGTLKYLNEIGIKP